MTKAHGQFVWYELMTTDMRAAEKFYRDVIGWGARDAGMPDAAYTLFTVGDGMVGGLMALPEEARAEGAQPGWVGYVAVDDLEASIAKLTAAGGTVHKGPMDIPGIGRAAYVADPHGAVIALFWTDQGEAPAVPPGTPGHAGWHELMAGDGPEAFAFYSGLFGWTRDQAMDMGEMGVYQLFAAGAGAVGAMMTKPADCPRPFWNFYFNVEAIDAAQARVKAGGGKVVTGPMDVPNEQWIIQCLDPQGAFFSLVAPHR
jgi:hypothetical protein